MSLAEIEGATAEDVEESATGVAEETADDSDTGTDAGEEIGAVGVPE